MNLSDYVEQITPELKWKSVDVIPDFPAKSFVDLIGKIESRTLVVATDYTVSNQFAWWLYGKSYCTFYAFATWFPYILGIALLVLAFLLKNYWLIVGIPFCVFSVFIANPYNPVKNLMNVLFLLFVIALIYGLWQRNLTITILPVAFIVPFLLTRFIYSINQTKLIETALSSEKLLIYLYQNWALYLRDSSDGRLYSYQGENRE